MRRRNLLKYLWLEAIALNCHATPVKASTWSYQGATGIGFWGEIAPEFQVCQTGKAQSPINIESEVISEVGSLELNYQETPLKIVNNSRTIRVDYQPGSSLTLDGQKYKLLQFHFHQPSEHLVSGQMTAMEAHFVHQHQETGELLVLAVLMAAGQINQKLDTIWRKIPAAGQAAQIADLTINALQLLPENSRQYYRYQGSLTTPPCTENVTWLVLKQPITVSRSQIDRFLQVIGDNARPVQALNNRVISEIN